jgi:predicted secreted protein
VESVNKLEDDWWKEYIANSKNERGQPKIDVEMKKAFCAGYDAALKNYHIVDEIPEVKI